jgi:hypothetical protein
MAPISRGGCGLIRADVSRRFDLALRDRPTRTAWGPTTKLYPSGAPEASPQDASLLRVRVASEGGIPDLRLALGRGSRGPTRTVRQSAWCDAAKNSRRASGPDAHASCSLAPPSSNLTLYSGLGARDGTLERHCLLVPFQSELRKGGGRIRASALISPLRSPARSGPHDRPASERHRQLRAVALDAAVG